MAFTYQQAIELVYESLATDYVNPHYGPPKIFEADTIEHEWGWVFFYNTEMFFKTRDLQYAAIGIGPLFFNRETGEIRLNPTGPSTEKLIFEYEEELIAGDKHWCLFLSKGCDRKASILGIKGLLKVTSSEAFGLVRDISAPVFTGKRRHLDWLRTELERYDVLCHLELIEDAPKCANFNADEYEMSDSIADVYHGR